WDIATIPEVRFFLWLLLFLLLCVLALWIRDGRFLLGVLLPVWGGLSWLFKISFLLPLAFLSVSTKRGPFASWLRWGGSIAALGWFLLFRGHYYFRWDLEPAWDLWIGQGAGVFLVTGLLGAGDRVNEAFGHCRLSWLLLVLGAWAWGG